MRFVSLRSALGDIRGRAALIVIGCLIAQLGLAFGYVFPALAKDILTEMGWSRAEFSFARLPQLAAMAAASPIVGILTFRHGARRVILAAIVLLGGVFLLFPGITSLYQYYALMVVAGLALTGVGDISVGHLVSRWVHRSRGLALGMVYTGSNIGGVLGIPILVQLADGSGWRMALFVMGIFAFAAMLPITTFLLREIKEESATEEAAMAEGKDDRNDLDLKQALRTRSYWSLFFSLFTFFFYFLALLEHMVLFFTDGGMARSDAVTHYATAIGLGIWSKLLLGFLADRIHEKYSLLLDYGLLTLSSLLLLTVSDAPLLWLFVFSFGFSYAARDVVYPLIVTHCFGLRSMAPIYGALMISLVLGAAGPFFAAAVHDHFGNYDVAFRTFFALNVIALIALLFIRDERESNPAQMPAH